MISVMSAHLSRLASALVLGSGFLITLSGCYQSTPSRTECQVRFEGDEKTYCDTVYYRTDGSVESVSRDLITDIAQAEEIVLNSQGRHYSDKFELSAEQGLKIARTIRDFNQVQKRTDADLADFAQRLYGVEPSRIVSAVGRAQAGEPASLDSLVNEAAQRFETTPGNMKRIVRELHGKLLSEQGVSL